MSFNFRQRGPAPLLNSRATAGLDSSKGHRSNEATKMTRRTKPKQQQQATATEQAKKAAEQATARAVNAEQARRRLNNLLLEAVDVLEKELKGPDALRAAGLILALGLQNSPARSKQEDLPAAALLEELLRAGDHSKQ